MKKIITFILALSLILSAVPMVSMAAVSNPVMADACYVYSTSPNTIRGGTRLQVDNSSRHSFIKFDFSSYSLEDILKIDSVTLKVRWRQDTYTGLTAAIMPADMEWWDSTTLNYTLANENGLMNTSRDICLQKHTDTAAVTSTSKYITISNLQEGIVSHLLSDTDDKIVSLRLRALGGGYVLDCQSSNDVKPSLTVTANASDEKYVNNVASLISFDKISSQNIYSVNQNLNLSTLTLPDDVNINWLSSNPALISNEGVVNCPADITPVKLTATVSLKSNPEITAQKLFNITLDPNDGATNYYYWDFDNLDTLDTYYNSGNSFMMEHPDIGTYVPVTLADDPVTSNGNKVAKADWSTGAPGELLVFTTELASDVSNVRYLCYRSDVCGTSDGNIRLAYRTSSSSKTGLWRTKGFNPGEWESYMTIVDTKNATGMRYMKTNDEWTSYDYESKDNAIGFAWDGSASASPARISLTKEAGMGVAYLDNVSIKGYQDLYLEVNSATEDNVLTVLEAFDNMQIISLPVGYDEADKTLLANLIKSKTYASDDEVMLVLERYFSNDDIIITAEVKADNKLKSVKFATKETIADKNVSFIAASYCSDKTLIAVGITTVADVAFDTWNTVTDIDLDIENASYIKYMLWDSTELSFKPLAKASEK